MVVPGVQERFLASEELLGSFLLRVRAPDVAGPAEGPRVLVLGRRLGAEVVEGVDQAIAHELACHE